MYSLLMGVQWQVLTNGRRVNKGIVYGFTGEVDFWLESV